jgi:C-terminal processing protease CtpA/Prc
MHFYPMHLQGLAPDVKIPYTFSDYRTSRDPLMDYVLRQAQN